MLNPGRAPEYQVMKSLSSRLRCLPLLFCIVFVITSLPGAVAAAQIKAPPELVKILKQNKTPTPVRSETGDEVTEEASKSPPTGVTLVFEGFEAGMLPLIWTTFDNDGVENGLAFWDYNHYRSDTGSHSADCAGSAVVPGQNYLNNMQSWMVSADPEDLSDALAGYWSFRYWTDIAPDGDVFYAALSVDGESFYGLDFHGNSGGWQSAEIDLASVPGLGDVTGEPEVWIAFIFNSDASGTAEGVFIDSIYMEKLTTPVTPDADLEVQLVNVPEGSYYPGESFVLENLVVNTGDVRSDEYTIQFVLSTNTHISRVGEVWLPPSIDRAALEPGASDHQLTTLNLPTNPPNPYAGQWYVGARLVSWDANRVNNVNLDPVPITLLQRPAEADLALTILDAENGTYASGKIIKVLNRTVNIGGETSDPYQISFYVSLDTDITNTDWHMWTWDLAPLELGDVDYFNDSLLLPEDLPDGDYYIGAILTVSDLNASNNVRYDPVPVTIDGDRIFGHGFEEP